MGPHPTDASRLSGAVVRAGPSRSLPAGSWAVSRRGSAVGSLRHVLRGQRLTTVLLVLVLAVNVGNFIAPALAPGQSALPTTCASQVPLTARTDGVLGRHHQWLETPARFAEPSVSFWQLHPHVVVNTRTGLGYNWSLDDTDRSQEQLRFAVLTRWALLHPGWNSDPWVLLYDCPPLRS
jgi:hypothetical protein